MINFMAKNDENGRIILGIIIEQGNIDHFLKRRPMNITAEQMNLPEIRCNEITIFYYPTQQEAIDDLKKRGFITDETITRAHRPFKSKH